MIKQSQAKHGQGPSDVKQGHGAGRLRGKRVTAMTGFALLRRLNPGEFVDRIEHTIRRCSAADDTFPAEIVPNLSVMLAGLLEQSGRSAGNVSTVTSGIVRRSLERVCFSRSKRRGSSGARCASIFSGAVILLRAAASDSAKEFRSFSDTSQLGLTKDAAKARMAAAQRMPTDSVALRRTGMPKRIQTAAKKSDAAMKTEAASARSRRTSPRRKACSISEGV